MSYVVDLGGCGLIGLDWWIGLGSLGLQSQDLYSQVAGQSIGTFPAAVPCCAKLNLLASNNDSRSKHLC